VNILPKKINVFLVSKTKRRRIKKKKTKYCLAVILAKYTIFEREEIYLEATLIEVKSCIKNLT